MSTETLQRRARTTTDRVVVRARSTSDRVLVRARRIKHALGIPGAIAVVALIFGELVATELQMLLDTHREVLAVLGGLVALMLLLAMRWTRQLPGVTASYGDPGTDKLPTRRGLVLLVGLDSAAPDSPAAKLLASLPNLEYLALVGTPETESLSFHDTIVSKLAPSAGRKLDADKVRSWHFGNAESISDSEQATSEAIRWMMSMSHKPLQRDLDASEIVVDVSSGRRPMIFGAKDAADEHFVETQYLSPTWDHATNRPVPGTSMFKVIKSYY